MLYRFPTFEQLGIAVSFLGSYSIQDELETIDSIVLTPTDDLPRLLVIVTAEP